MDNKLTKEEIGILQKYRLTSFVKDSFNTVNLLDDKFLISYIHALGPFIGSPSSKITASIFVKRYAFLAVISLYMMTKGNKRINLSLNNVNMEATISKGIWLPTFSLNDVTTLTWDSSYRDPLREMVLKDLFADHIYRIIKKIEETFNISSLILWENIAVYIFWLYEAEFNCQTDTVLSDFHYIVSEAEGELFGPYKENPLKRFFSEKIFEKKCQEEVRLRRTCCFSYQLQSRQKRCKTCPCSHIPKEEGCHDGEGICSAVRGTARKIQ